MLTHSDFFRDNNFSINNFNCTVEITQYQTMSQKYSQSRCNEVHLQEKCQGFFFFLFQEKQQCFSRQVDFLRIKFPLKIKLGRTMKRGIYGVIMSPRSLFFLCNDMSEVNDKKPSDKVNKNNHLDKGKTLTLSKICLKCYCST